MKVTLACSKDQASFASQTPELWHFSASHHKSGKHRINSILSTSEIQLLVICVGTEWFGVTPPPQYQPLQIWTKQGPKSPPPDKYPLPPPDMPPQQMCRCNPATRCNTAANGLVFVTNCPVHFLSPSVCVCEPSRKCPRFYLCMVFQVLRIQENSNSHCNTTNWLDVMQQSFRITQKVRWFLSRACIFYIQMKTLHKTFRSELRTSILRGKNSFGYDHQMKQRQRGRIIYISHN